MDGDDGRVGNGAGGARVGVADVARAEDADVHVAIVSRQLASRQSGNAAICNTIPAMRITHIGPLSVAKVAFVLYGVPRAPLRRVLRATWRCLAPRLGAAAGEESALFGAVFGVGAVIVLPILYGCMGAVAGALPGVALQHRRRLRGRRRDPDGVEAGLRRRRAAPVARRPQRRAQWPKAAPARDAALSGPLRSRSFCAGDSASSLGSANPYSPPRARDGGRAVGNGRLGEPPQAVARAAASKVRSPSPSSPCASSRRGDKRPVDADDRGGSSAAMRSAIAS